MVTELKDVLCYSIDAESKDGRVIARRFDVTAFPMLLFLEPDGNVRDVIGGFLPPDAFTAEVKRIKKNESTLSSFKERIASSPFDLEVRWRYAQKLMGLGDKQGYEREVAFIRKTDPEGTSIGSRHLRFQELKQESLEDFELQPVYDFLEKETDAELQLDGWYFLFKLESYLAEHDELPERRPEHRRLQVSAARALWSHVPAPLLLRVAGEIVSVFTSAPADQLSREHKRFLLEVGKAAVEAGPEDPSVLALNAQCLFTAGRKEEAIRQLGKCVELDPKNSRWREMRARFEDG